MAGEPCRASGHTRGQLTGLRLRQRLRMAGVGPPARLSPAQKDPEHEGDGFKRSQAKSQNSGFLPCEKDALGHGNGEGFRTPAPLRARRIGPACETLQQLRPQLPRSAMSALRKEPSFADVAANGHRRAKRKTPRRGDLLRKPKYTSVTPPKHRIPFAFGDTPQRPGQRSQPANVIAQVGASSRLKMVVSGFFLLLSARGPRVLG